MGNTEQEAHAVARGNCVYWAAKFLRMSRNARLEGDWSAAAWLLACAVDETRRAVIYAKGV